MAEELTVIPCQQNLDLQQQIRSFAEILKTQAHTLGDHGLAEDDFYYYVFRGAIERIRGQYSATMGDKRQFAAHILNYMQDRRFIGEWEPAGEANRHDYYVPLPSGRTAIIELKGCLDGNNTNIVVGPFELPPPCLYVLPATIPSPRNNPSPQPQSLDDVQILQAFSDCFRCYDNEINYVGIDVAHQGADTVRATRIVRDGVTQRESKLTAIRRS